MYNYYDYSDYRLFYWYWGFMNIIESNSLHYELMLIRRPLKSRCQAVVSVQYEILRQCVFMTTWEIKPMIFRCYHKGLTLRRLSRQKFIRTSNLDKFVTFYSYLPVPFLDNYLTFNIAGLHPPKLQILPLEISKWGHGSTPLK